jgi:oxygen-independent coproporphyrinogen-3 oxidase
MWHETSHSRHIPLAAGILPAMALYLHIPYCHTRCTYCAFNTYTGLSNQISHYLAALRRELQLVTQDVAYPAHTIYFGGGTPSLIPAHELEAVLACCADTFTLVTDLEITLEANPGTVNQPYLEALRRCGVNRLSIGMQSAQAADLKLFARRHSLADVQTTVKQARAAGFDNISLDLIYGSPGQSLETWQTSLNAALSMFPDHLSLYSLGVEDGTPLQHWIAQGKLAPPDPDLAADMYDWATDRLAATGFEQYEISNWARPGFACRHNLHYWRNLPYLGLGAGAHGYAGGVRYVNVYHPTAYIERIQNQTDPLPFPLSAAAEEFETIDSQQTMAETMMMGLRLIQEGISPTAFLSRFGRDLWTVYGPQLDRLLVLGLLERGPDARLRLTHRARLIGNRVFAEFV